MISKQTLLDTLDIFKDKLGKIYIKKKEVTQAQYDALSEEEKNSEIIYLINDAYDNASGGGHVALTQAEYNALSHEAKNSGIVYLITDADVEGGSGSGHVELTQAEYNALSDGEKYNGTVYLITDASGGSGSGGHIELTQAEYDALSEEEKNNGTVYLITDASDIGEAGQIAYDNTTSSLSANNVQVAVDELNLKKANFIPWCNYVKLGSASTDSIVIKYKELPVGRTVLLILGNGNSIPFSTVLAVEANLNGVVATSTDITCKADSATKSITITGLRSWGNYFVFSPDYIIEQN